MRVQKFLGGLLLLAITSAAFAGGVPANGTLPDRWGGYTHTHKDGETLGIIFEDFGVPWIIKGDKLSLPRIDGDTFRAGADGEVFAYKLLPAEVAGGLPRIDLSPVAGPDKGKVHQGIF